MPMGYVYVLINSAMEGIVKIGSTTDSSESRAAAISRATGVPTAFLVVYEEHVSDCKAAEKRVHEKLEYSRVNRKREFFRVPVKVAVKAVQETALQFTLAETSSSAPALDELEIIPELRSMYAPYLRSEIVSAKIVRRNGVCYLEVHSKPSRHFYDEDIVFVDLAIVSSGDAPMFPPERPAAENAATFLRDLDPYSIIMCTPLFTESGASEIARRYEKGDGA